MKTNLSSGCICCIFLIGRGGVGNQPDELHVCVSNLFLPTHNQQFDSYGHSVSDTLAGSEDDSINTLKNMIKY